MPLLFYRVFSAEFVRKLLWWALLLVLLLRAFIWMQQSMPDFPTQNIEEYVDFTGRAPFVYRMLLPGVVAVIEAATPLDAQRLLADATRSTVMVYTSTIWTPSEIWTRSDRFYFVRFVAGTISLLLLAGYAILLYRLAEALMPDTPAASIAPLLGLFLIPIGLWQAAYFYDAGTLFFMTLGWYLLMMRRFRAYWFCLVLACMNRETAWLLIVLSWFCWRGWLPASKLYWLMALQLFTYGAIMLAIRTLITPEVGSYTLHIYNNINQLTESFGAVIVVSILMGLCLLLYRWQEKPLALRQTVWVIVPMVVLWLIFGRFQEVRAMYEVFPFVTLLLAHSFSAMLGKSS
jgi:hypothetical protein